jgi:hypothetical protein
MKRRTLTPPVVAFSKLTCDWEEIEPHLGR